MSQPLIEVKNLQKFFKIHSGIFSSQMVRAVDDVSFSIKQGETLGLVGESGCGKSTLGRAVLRLHEPTGGKIIYEGKDITKIKNMRPYRRNMQIIFQDPYASLDPRMTVGDIIGEPIDIHQLTKSKGERRDRIIELLRLVGLTQEHLSRYPHEFSGGQRQRISIARALAVEPNFMVCDEPISALDVSIQAQVINKMVELQQKLGLTYLFIAHDLSVVRHISDRVGVMYLGRLAEITSSHELYKNPIHPYTQALLSSIPIPDPKVSREKKHIVLEGDVPSPIKPPSGCTFRTRCPYAKDICKEVRPELREVQPGHEVACHKVWDYKP